MTARHRLLVALLLEGAAATEVEGLRRALGTGQLSRIPPHVTLVEPTNVRDEEMPGVVAGLDALGAGARPFAAQLGPVATFAPRRPVVYLQVSDDGELERLRRGAAQDALAPPPGRADRPFVPHVTLSSRVAPDLVVPAVALLAGYERSVTFSRLHLLEQEGGTPDHPWHVVTSALLGGTALVGRGGRELELTVGDALDRAAAAWAGAAWDDYARATYGPGWRRDEPFAITVRDRSAVGTARDRVVGVATGEICGEVCECEQLIVDPSARGEGVGSHLLRHVERLATERGCRTVRLRTLDGGPAARFYEARGFVRTAFLRAWREGRDFVVMVRVLPRV